MPKPRIVAIVNTESGTVKQRGPEAVQALIEESLAGVRVELVDGKALMRRIEKAVKTKESEIILVGGGDGSVTSAAALTRGSGVTLAALPLGTFNMFVQALGFTPDLETALKELATAQPVQVDTAEVNGRLFLHQVSFGLQPRMARLRERMGYGSRFTKMLAATVASLLVLLRPRPQRFVVQRGAAPGVVAGQAVMISNNLYAEDRPMIPARLDGGVLGLYVIAPRRWGDYLRLALDYLKGGWKQGDAVAEHATGRLKLAPRGRRFSSRRAVRLLATVDGELGYLDAPFVFEVQPGALKVLAPAPLPSAAPGANLG